MPGANPQHGDEYKRAAFGADRVVPRRLVWVLALGSLAILGTVIGVRAVPEPVVAWNSPAAASSRACRG